MKILIRPTSRHARRNRRGIAWVEVCLILTLLGVMAALAWLGAQRESARKASPRADSAVGP